MNIGLSGPSLVNSTIKSMKSHLHDLFYKRTLPCLHDNGGGVTVEAALVIPVFLFFIINMMSLYLVLESYSAKQADLNDMAKSLSAVSTDLNSSGDLDYIDLWNVQAVAPIVKAMGFSTSVAPVHSYTKKWTGYDLGRAGAEAVREKNVYITEYGTVYHTTLSCKHLDIKPVAYDISEVGALRNDSGGKYYPCLRCVKSQSSIVFLTEDGDRYHNSINCSSLKRTVQVVTLSEAIEWGRTPCSICGD